MVQRLLCFFICLNCALAAPEVAISPLKRSSFINTPFSKAEILKAKGPEDLFKEDPSINIIQNGGPGTSSTLTVRGLYSRYLLVVEDGMTLNSPAYGGYDISEIDVSAIDQMTFIKGPETLLYGSGSMSGVLKSETLTLQTIPSVFLEGQIGSNQTNSFATTLKTHAKNAFYGLHIRRFATGGLPASSPRKIGEENAYNAQNIKGRFAFFLTPLLEFNTLLGSQETTLKLDRLSSLPNLPLKPEDRIEARTQSYKISTTYRPLYEKAQRSLNFYETTKYHDTFYQNAFYLGKREQVQELTYESQDPLTKTQALTFKGGILRENFKERDHFQNINRFLAGLYEIALLPSLKLAGSLRFDSYADFKDQKAYAMSATYDFSKKTQGYLSYGTGSKLPSLSQRFGHTFFMQGNPTLKPETSKSFEGSLKHIFTPEWEGQVTGFLTTINDLIQTRYNGTFYQPQNVSTLSSRGIEMKGSYTPPLPFSLKAAYSYTDASTREEKPVALEPFHRARLIFLAKFSKKSEGSLTISYTGKRYDYDYTTAHFKKIPLKAYVLVDSDYSYLITPQTTALFSIKNLFNRSYTPSATLPYGTPGRTFYFTLRFEF